MYVASNLKFLMNAYSISGKKLAKEMGWNDNVITSYRTGTNPPLEKANLLADYFGVSLDDFVNTDLKTKGIPTNKEVQSKAEDSTLKAALDVMTKQVERYEKRIRERAPDLAKELGLDE